MKVSQRKKCSFYFSVVLILLFSTTFGAIQRLDSPVVREGEESILLPSSLMAAEPRPAFRIEVPGENDLMGGGGLLTDDDLLKRKFNDDCGQYDLELITVEDGGELEVWESEMEIPEYAIDEDTWMVLFVPISNFIEYWVYPPSIEFYDSVEVTLSYQFANLRIVDEENISIVQWIPQFQMWQNIGGVVDTLDNEIDLKIISFPPPGTDFSRFALADHN